MRIDPETSKRIEEAIAAGRAAEGPPAAVPPPGAPAIPMPGVELYKPSSKARVRRRASVREGEFMLQVIEYAHLRRWRVAHFRAVCVRRANGETYYETPVAADGKGFPDLLMVRGPVLLVAELKVEGNTTSPEQDKWLEAFRTAGVRGHVWFPRDWPSIEEVLR